MALSRTMRQTTVGLLALVSLGALGWLLVWLQGWRSSGGSYRATIVFPNAGGMKTGTSVSYRGVAVGQVLRVQPNIDGVDLEVEISPATLPIPLNSRIEANQSGLIGETAIDITPLQDLPNDGSLALPLSEDCDRKLIICNGARLTGEGQLDLNALIRSVLRISNILGSPEFASNLNAVARNASVAFVEVSELGAELRETLDERPLDKPLAAITAAADGIDEFFADVEGPFVSSLESLDRATVQISQAIDDGSDRAEQTLDNIETTSDAIRDSFQQLTPILATVNQSDLIENFETLSKEAAAAAENVRTLTDGVSDPESILQIQKTLDSARAAFENIMKITADVDELTGNPKFREDLRQLVESLEDLLSSTQQLEQQVAQAQFDRVNRILSAKAEPPQP